MVLDQEPADPSYFGYKAHEGDNLQQGDILGKDDALSQLFQKIYPYYLKEDYAHFLVLTQTCDLARRENSDCKSRYIALSAVRPFSTVLRKAIEKHQNSFARAGNVCSTKHKVAIAKFLSRLFNNNDPEYFYLPASPIHGFYEDACAFLRLTVSIRKEHYDKCLDARLLSLQDVFQAKLGWLTGNIYSRVGTEDWVPNYKTGADFEEMIASRLDGACEWVGDKVWQKAKKDRPKELEDKSTDEIRKYISTIKPPTRREVILKELAKVLNETGIFDDEEKVKDICQRLGNRPLFKQHTKG
jgi:hypothetical protein